MPSPILKYFKFAHLPEHLQKVSRPFGELAERIDNETPDGPEKSAGLRKLLEAKDCIVRAVLPLLMLALLLLPGCQRSEPLTLDQWKEWHPWCDPVDVTHLKPADQAAGLTVLVAIDAIPHVHPVTGRYEREHGLHILRVRDGIVVDRRWRIGNSFAD